MRFKIFQETVIHLPKCKVFPVGILFQTPHGFPVDIRITVFPDFLQRTDDIIDIIKNGNYGGFIVIVADNVIDSINGPAHIKIHNDFFQLHHFRLNIKIHLYMFLPLFQGAVLFI